MNGIISIIIGSYKAIYIAIFGAAITAYYFLINKNAKLKSENKALNEGIEEIKDESKKIVAVQKKQADIAARPASSRDDVHKQLHNLSRRPRRDSK